MVKIQDAAESAETLMVSSESMIYSSVEDVLEKIQINLDS
jgi:hypothetical protein